MTLDDDVCWALLATRHHGSFGTVHPIRGVDAVPVVFAVLPDRRIVVPVDAIKQKRTARLQRVINVEADSRCVLLVDHYAPDWSQLWWVRVHATAKPAAATPELHDALAARFPQYQSPAAIVTALILTPSTMSGWSARAT